MWSIGYFLIGIALAALLDATGLIWPSILLHAAWNGLIVLGEIGSVIAVVLLALSAAVVLLSPLWFGVVWIWNRLRRKRSASSS